MLNLYTIEGALNLDGHSCFNNPNSYPNFQEDLELYKSKIKELVEKKENKSFLKFGDGDYFFLKQSPVGSASPGKRALSKSYNQIDMQSFYEGSKMNDYYTCEIYPENINMFREVIDGRKIDFPAEYGYGLIANKWFFRNFSGKIGLIGADNKIELIKKLLEHDQYKDYLQIEKFEDYIKIPQKFACDNILDTEEYVGKQLENSTSDIFLVGVGHVKSALNHRLKKYKNAIYLDVGSGIDAISGVIDVYRPYFGNWTNYQIKNDPIYQQIDYLGYNNKGDHKYL